MRLIFEGPDGSGKTTLQEKIAESMPTHHKVRLDKPSPNETEESWHRHFRVTFCSAAAQHDDLLVSRCHVSDPIYGKMLRDQVLITPWRYTHLNMLLESLGFVVVFCQAETRTLQKRLKDRGLDDEYDRLMYERLPELNRRYHDAAMGYAGSHLFYNSEFDTPESWLKEHGPQMEANLRRIPRNLSGIGTPRGGVVLLGDRFSGHYTGRVSMKLVRSSPPGTFTPFDTGGSSRYLLERLANLKQTGGVYIMNSRFDDSGEADSVPKLRKELEILDRWYKEHMDIKSSSFRLRLVALGEQAAWRLRQAGHTGFVQVTHPQSWRRFHHADKNGYAKALKEAIGV